MNTNPYEVSQVSPRESFLPVRRRNQKVLLLSSVMLAVFGVSALIWKAIETRGMPRRYASYVPDYDILFPIQTTETIGWIAIVASVILASIAIARKRHS
ncbi:MAG: hypothetical protein MUC83_18710 [Pirellula sp.]|jgi:heme/copper-type cytochrome/quinol oxidase subunit 1|nr:hypothetical protein [Pirellula sp.]